jgi:hypothetical protein
VQFGDKTSEVVGIRIAGLGLWLDARAVDFDFTIPTSHVKFLDSTAQPRGPQHKETLIANDDLILLLRNKPLSENQLEESPQYSSETWAFNINTTEQYVFIAPNKIPPIQIVVDPKFTTGEIWGDFSLITSKNSYPIQDLEIRLFSAWLASFGDIILHASGVDVDNNGYAFIGHAGAGKTTLVKTLASTNLALTPLAEDQLVLRYKQDCFWIYGTPWHLDPAMCNPHGVRVKKVFFLDRSASLGITPIKRLDAITRILQTAFIPYYLPDILPDILERLDLFTRQVPFYVLNYQLGTDPWPLIHNS